MKFKAIIVDDEAPARRHLRRLLEAHPEVEVAGEASRMGEALEVCRELDPDVLFLDIHMPKANGFDLLRKLARPPRVVFVTAHGEFGVKAFDVNAMDYLMKPVSPERLALTIAKLKAEAVHPAEPAGPVLLEKDGSLKAVDPSTILWVEADGNYSRVVLAGETSFVHRSLAEWEGQLENQGFVRLDRSLLVNQTKVAEVTARDRNAGEARFAGREETLPLGRTALARQRRLLAEWKRGR